MYSPKIREDLIPRIYRAAKNAGVKMTQWVNRVIEEALPPDVEEKDQEINERNLASKKANHDDTKIGEKIEEKGVRQNDSFR